MDEKEREFSLEDILKEFGETIEDPVTEPESPAEESQPQEAEETVCLEPLEDTIPMDTVPEDTIRLDTAAFVKGVVHNAQPLDEPDYAQPQEEQPMEETEDTAVEGQWEPEYEQPQEEQPVEGTEDTAFEGQWEPEYEQPIGEYVPPQPIIFHPRSRLRELKKKLVEGPERRYYQLSEKGVGRLQIAIFFSLLVVLISAGSTMLYAMGMVQQDRLRLMVFGQFLAMLLSVLLGYNQMIAGVIDLLRGRFSLNTLLVVTFAVCCLDGVLCLQQLHVPCCAAFSLEMTMSLWAAYQSRNTELQQMDTMRKAARLDSLVVAGDYYKGAKGLLKSEGQVEDFMDTYGQRSRTEKIQSAYSIFVAVAAVGIGITAGVIHGLSTGIQVAAVSLLAAVPVVAFVVYTRPMAILEKRLHALGTVLCGWQGVERLQGKAVLPLEHNDLFPQGMVKMNGVKFFGDRDPDQIVAYATALVVADGGGLTPLFTQLLDARNGRHYDAKNFRGYDNGGIGGEVCSEPVLVGALPFLKEMGVELPNGLKISQAVGVAIDGELCGLFAVVYERSRAVAAALSALCACRSVAPLVISNDFMLTPGFLRAKFGVHPKRIRFPERTECTQLQERLPDEDSPAVLLTTREGLAPMVFGVVGARALWTACRVGTIIYMLGGILGLTMMLTLTLLGAVDLISPANMFLYQLVWLIPGLLVTQWTKVI